MVPQELMGEPNTICTNILPSPIGRWVGILAVLYIHITLCYQGIKARLLVADWWGLVENLVLNNSYS